MEEEKGDDVGDIKVKQMFVGTNLVTRRRNEPTLTNTISNAGSRRGNDNGGSR